jgi:hypothetical protein
MAASQSRDDPACPAALTTHEATLHPFPGPIRGIPRSPLKADSRVDFMDSTRVPHNMPGRFLVGVLIGLTIVALVFGLT